MSEENRNLISQIIFIILFLGFCFGYKYLFGFSSLQEFYDYIANELQKKSPVPTMIIANEDAVVTKYYEYILVVPVCCAIGGLGISRLFDFLYEVIYILFGIL